MNNKFSQTRRRLEVREIELYIKIMNKILGIVVFSLFLNINVNAEIIGGCCGVGPKRIEAISNLKN